MSQQQAEDDGERVKAQTGTQVSKENAQEN